MLGFFSSFFSSYMTLHSSLGAKLIVGGYNTVPLILYPVVIQPVLKLEFILRIFMKGKQC